MHAVIAIEKSAGLAHCHFGDPDVGTADFSETDQSKKAVGAALRTLPAVASARATVISSVFACAVLPILPPDHHQHVSPRSSPRQGCRPPGRAPPHPRLVALPHPRAGEPAPALTRPLCPSKIERRVFAAVRALLVQEQDAVRRQGRRLPRDGLRHPLHRGRLPVVRAPSVAFALQGQLTPVSSVPGRSPRNFPRLAFGLSYLDGLRIGHNTAHRCRLRGSLEF